MRGPFDTLESAHEYVTLLLEQVREVKVSVESDVTEAISAGGGRRLDALRLVDFKLSRLEQHLVAGSRTLNDLRALRKLLLGGAEVRSTDDAYRAKVPAECEPA